MLMSCQGLVGRDEYGLLRHEKGPCRGSARCYCYHHQVRVSGWCQDADRVELKADANIFRDVEPVVFGLRGEVMVEVVSGASCLQGCWSASAFGPFMAYCGCCWLVVLRTEAPAPCIRLLGFIVTSLDADKTPIMSLQVEDVLQIVCRKLGEMLTLRHAGAGVAAGGGDDDNGGGGQVEVKGGGAHLADDGDSGDEDDQDDENGDAEIPRGVCSLPTPGAAEKTLAGAGHVTIQNFIA